MRHVRDGAAIEQSSRALELANRVRRARAELKARIADGQLGAAEVILTCPYGTATMPLAQLLASQRGWGDARCRAFLARASVHEQKVIGSLTERQRRVIASLLTHASRGVELDGAAG